VFQHATKFLNKLTTFSSQANKCEFYEIKECEIRVASGVHDNKLK